MTRMDRRALFASGAAAALLAASGVSAAAQRGGHLRAALSGASRSDSFSAPGGRFMQAAASAVFEGLTEIAADGTLRGELAMRWSSDAEARVWTFALRDSLFHDDQPITEDDLRYSLSGLGHVQKTKEGVSITLDKPDQNLPYRLAHPEFLIKPADTARRQFGSGLYKVHKFDAGRHFIAQRQDQHWKDGQAGWFDKIEFVHFEDPQVRAQALSEGLVDVADVADLDAYSDEADFQRLPDNGNVMQIASRRIAVPAQIGRAFALDNLRMSERWWMA